MFLLKRTTFVLLMTTFEILLSSVHIQPAQALVCYGCPDRKLEAGEKCLMSGAASTTKMTCPEEGDVPCYEMEIRYLNQWNQTARIVSRGCGDLRHYNLSCEEFMPWTFTPELGPAESKLCNCQTDLCNRKLGHKEKVSEKVKEMEKKNASIRIRSMGQLLLFCIIVSVSTSWN